MNNPSGSPFPANAEYLVFSIEGRQYAVPGSNVVSVINMPVETVIPHVPPAMRGIISFQENNVTLFDLRTLFGIEGRKKEIDALISNMAARKQDHINWLNTLLKEVDNHQTITVQTNPHLCAFGKWYDKFTTDNLQLRSYMERFDTPHKEIHALAITAAELAGNDDTAGAHTLIKQAESGVLAKLLNLFDGIGDLVRRYMMEYAIVCETDNVQFAIAVDDINFFSPLEKIEYPAPKGIARDENDIVQAVGRYRAKSEDEYSNILLLELGQITQQFDIDGLADLAPSQPQPVATA
ncbi:MAG: chemotaxis protein CheW [Magnetococcales bacterium]|nr:chemotaxis protein CheW [Magnetococcales bacterium]